MTDTQQPPPPPAEEPKSGEISLEDIDKLLETEDPEFTKSLEEVRAVEPSKDVVIDAAAIDESLAGDGDLAAKESEVKLSRWVRLKYAVRGKITGARQRF